MTIEIKEKHLVEQRLSQIANCNGGRLTADDVVKDAEDVESPLHLYIFNCDDATAAYEHRLYLARKLIASVHYESRTRSVTLISPLYVRDPSCRSKEQGYIRVVELKDHRVLAREVLEAEIGRIVSALERGQAVAKVLGLEQEFKRLLEHVTILGQKVKAA